jgi:hypothetical protein
MPELQARLSKRYDHDLIEAFKNVSNHSDRLRQLVRLGLAYEAHQRLGNTNLKNFTRQDVAQIENLEPEPIVIKMDNVKVHSPHAIVQNILAGFD